MMASAITLGACCLVAFGPLPVLLARASWPARAPRAAVLLWQAIGVAGSAAALGVALAVASLPLHQSVLGGIVRLFTGAAFEGEGHHGLNAYQALALAAAVFVAGGLLTGFGVTLTRTLRSRSRHRRLLDLVGRAGVLPGALVLEHPTAVAYCLPGLRPRIVLSAGAVQALQGDEVGAVVDHERGHGHAHHELVMLPLASLLGPFGWVPYARLAPRCVAVLLEMAADDFASRRRSRRTVAAALVHLVSAGGGQVPACGFAATASAVARRVQRLLDPAGNSTAVAFATLSACAVVLAAPALAVLGPSLLR